MTSANVQFFDAQNFESEVLKSDVPVLVHFMATWCGPAKALAPIIDGIADEFQGRIKVGKVDIDTTSAISARYGVRSIPTIIVFRGGAATGQHIGLTSRDHLVALLGVA